MKRDFRPESLRLYKLSHQILCITGINFENKSLIGYVELTIWPLRADLTSLRLNSTQSSIYKVTVDRKWEAEFTYFDPLMDICQGNAVKRNMDYYEKCQQNVLNSVDPDAGNGELIVTLPPQVAPTVSALSPLTLCIEFGVTSPSVGLHFVVPDMPGTMAERSAHVFTYAQENFSRAWFPCVDTFSEPCTWKIEITCDRDMTAVSCGDLVSVEFSEDMTEKTFHYFLSSPTAAPNLALAVGPFEILVDPKMHEVTHFCLPRLMPVLKHTTSYIHQAFEFYEELMSSRYPYSYYKQVFVDEAYTDVDTYSTMSILSTSLLHPAHIIDQNMTSRLLMSSAVAQQFFGSFIAMQSWFDAWLAKGITGYLSYLFCKRTFGNNEYRHLVMRDLEEVSLFEKQSGLIVLDPSRRDANHTFSVRSPHTLSPTYADMYAKKARLVMRMLEIRIGTELFLQVLNKLLSLAYNASQQPFSLTAWTNMLLSTSSFLKVIYTVTGKDIEPFIDQWVTQGGCARFIGKFTFNRKRNVVELDIKQDLTSQGATKFAGALNVRIQELDGSFNHTFKIEENKTNFEITCHSKSRRNKKKKIPLMTGEEVDMDLSAMDPDSPVLWLRLDPDMHLLRTVSFEQPDYMWQYQLKFERCIVAQFESITALGQFPTTTSRYALTDTIGNEECYHRVRQEACHCLAKIANQMVGTWTGPPAMMTIFRKMFGSHSCPFILRQNNFSNFHHYFLLKTMPKAMAKLRDTHNLCLTEVTKFLLDLFKYNDNSCNKWSDNDFRASLVEALAASITPAVTNVSLITGRVATADTLSPDTKCIVEEVVRALNLEKLMPSYKYTVTCSCLHTIRTLQKFGHLPNDSDVFKDYAQPGIFRDVRMAAITCLVDFIKGDITGEHLQWTLSFMEREKDPYLRHHTIHSLALNPPFKRSERSPLNIEPLVEQLWTMMTSSSLTYDHRVRCGLAHLYFTLYGRLRPTCLPLADSVKQAQKDKKAKSLLESQDCGVDSKPPIQLGAWNMDLASMFPSDDGAPTTIFPTDAPPADIFAPDEPSPPPAAEEAMMVSVPPVASEEVLGDIAPIKVDLEETVVQTHRDEAVYLHETSSEMIVGEMVALEEHVVTTEVKIEPEEEVVTPLLSENESKKVAVDLDVKTEVEHKTDNESEPETKPDMKSDVLTEGSGQLSVDGDETADSKTDIKLESDVAVTKQASSLSQKSGSLSEDSMSPPRLSPRHGPPEDVIVSLDNVIRNTTIPAPMFSPSIPPQHNTPSVELPKDRASLISKESLREAFAASHATTTPAASSLSTDKPGPPASPMFSPPASPLMSDEVEVCELGTPVKLPRPEVKEEDRGNSRSQPSPPPQPPASSSLLLQHLQMDTPLQTSNTSTSMSWMANKSEDLDEGPSTTEASTISETKQSLKTTLYTGGSSGQAFTDSSLTKERSSHHKSKKKKKKHKKEHKKHKHKHDRERGDREREERGSTDTPAERPRLLLNMSLSRAAAAEASRHDDDDDSDSDIDV